MLPPTKVRIIILVFRSRRDQRMSRNAVACTSALSNIIYRKNSGAALNKDSCQSDHIIGSKSAPNVARSIVGNGQEVCAGVEDAGRVDVAAPEVGRPRINHAVKHSIRSETLSASAVRESNE